MHFLKKIPLSALLVLPLLALFNAGSPMSSTHIQGDQSLVLPLEPTASIIEVGAHYQTERRFVSNIYEADHNFELLGLNWEQALPEGTSAALEIRFRTVKGVWTDWQSLEEDQDHPDGDEDLWTYVITDESEAFQYRVFLATQDTSITPKLSNVSFDAVDGGKDSPLATLQKLIFKDDNEVQTREDWGADEEMLLRRYYGDDGELSSDEEDYVETDPDLEIVKTITGDEDGNPYLWEQTYPKEVKKIIIHHTATSGSLSNPEESIRAIYYYHAVTRGWGDIGYNYIVDPEGTVYQGRAGDEGVVAGHASGYNTGTIGIALLGNYEENPVPGDMMQALTALVYEKADLHNINVDATGKYRGVSMENLLGHRDVDQTACPGDYTYDYLEDIRSVVADALDEDEEIGEFAYEETTDRELVLLDRGGDQAGIIIKIKNTGDETWNDETYLVVNANAEGDKIVTIPKDSKKHTAEMKESSVAPGKTASFSFTVKSTDLGGLAHFEATPVFNGEEKIDQYMDLGFYVEVEKKETESSNSDSEEEDEEDEEEEIIRDEYDDLTFDPGEKKFVWVQVKNTTESNWSSSGSKAFTLALTEPKGVETGETTAAFQTLKPGASSRVYFSITAPEEAGDYELSIRPRLGSTNLTTNAYKMDITVDGGEDFEAVDYENPIRIKLTPDNEVGTPTVTSTGVFALYDDEELLKIFEANSRAKVTASSSGFSVSSGSNKWTVDGAVRFVPEEEGIMKILTMDQTATWDASINDNKFRGTIEVREVEDETILINELPLEDYLKGMAEETNETPTEKLKTMAILARSYAYYYITQAEKFPGMPYDGEDDPSTFQKYLGYGYELRHPNVAEAAEDTEGMVVTYKGTVIKTPYFSQSDGVATKSAKEVWGWTNTPYLVSVPDTYCESTTFSGHGVGLSGCGAKALAEEGWSFEKIIKYYYTGVELGEIE